ncbi:MAG: type II toxin-antitoxin system VapC family toxin [Gemmatimonadota bacterium]
MTTPGRALIDTGALLAVANPRDQYHEEAVAIGRRFLAAGGRLIGTTLILAELHGHLLQLRGHETARTHLDRLLSDPVHEWIDTSEELVREASGRWLARFRDQAFSLTDAVSFEVARRLRLTSAFAFDHHFEVAGYERLR